MDKRTIIVTGASGFLGSAICVDLSSDCHVIGIDWRPPSDELAHRAGDTEWHRADIADHDRIHDLFRQIARDRSHVDYVIHMAAFYHFSRYWLPEYERTNVQGLKNILEGAAHTGAGRFIFAGSIASLMPPPPGGVLTEKDLASNYSAYTRSKSIGEKMLSQYSRAIPTLSLRIGGVFSDWCELPPLYSLIKLWHQSNVFGRMIPGKGLSGFPYIHRRDLVRIVRHILENESQMQRYDIVFGSPSGHTSHKVLFPEIRQLCENRLSTDPIFVSPGIARCVLYVKNRFKVLIGRKRYERRWMIDYVDLPLNVDASRTHALLRWAPTPELGILGRLPVMIRQFQQHPRQWEERNVRRNEGRYEYTSD